MTVIKDTKCKKTFVTARTVKENEQVECPLCGSTGFFVGSRNPVFKGEGFIE